MGEQVFTVTSLTELRPMFERAWAAAQAMAKGGPFELVLRLPTRSINQNRKLWPMLQDIADQLQWPVNGRLQRMSREDWKDVLTAGFQQESRVAEGIAGGHVFLGMRTSRMSKRQFSELVEFIYAFGSGRGVRFSAPSQTLYRDVTESRRAA